MPRQLSSRPGRRGGQAGFTFIELVVSMAILSLIGVVIGLSFSVGLQVLARPGSTKDRLAGAQDLTTLEELLSRDVHRAACIQTSAQGPLGSCANGYAHAVATQGIDCSSSRVVVCIGWPQYSGGPAEAGTCHIAEYWYPPPPPGELPGILYRSEYLDTTPAPPQTSTRTTDPVSASTSLQTITTSDGTWVSLLQVTLTGLGISVSSNPPAGTLRLAPLSADPAASTADVTGGAPIC